MEDFFVDKIGNHEEEEENPNALCCEDDDADDFIDEEKLDLYEELLKTLDCVKEKKQKKKECSLDDTYLITSYLKEKPEETFSSDVDKILRKSNIPPGLEKQICIPSKSARVLKIERKREREKTKGDKWYNIPATRMTNEIRADFRVLQMRSVLGQHQVYKKNTITRIPKYFQVGRVVENAADFYSGRIPKSQRKKTMVDELLADAEFKRYQKKKYKEIMNEQLLRRWSRKNKKKNKKGSKK